MTSVAEMMADMDAHLASIGLNPAKYAVQTSDQVAPERTRYATPGATCGRGRVRLLSAKQVAFIKRLMAERDTRNLVRLPGSEDIEFMSLRGASDLIERLLACPEIPAKVAQGNLASEKQVAFALSLTTQKLAIHEGTPEYATAKANLEKLTKREISAKIDQLKALADAPVQHAKAANSAPALPDVPEGRYAVEIDGTLKFYQVDRPTEGRWAGFVFLKVQASDETYPIKNASAKREILAEIAKDTMGALLRYGREIGRCGHCNRTLTDETSRARGIGPKCATYL